MLRIFLSAYSVFLLTGCASLLSEKKQAIIFKTSCNKVSIPATCTAENTKGKWTFTTPKVVTIHTDISELKITCRSPYTPQHKAQASSKPNLAFAGNILIGGIFGAAVDVANARGFQYPSDIEIINPFCKQL